MNPWDRLIGPNRYLLEMLRHVPELASRATVVFHEANGALGEYEALGCQVMIEPDVAQIRANPTVSNALGVIRRNTVGVERLTRLIREVRPDLIVSNTEQLGVGKVASRLVRLPHLQIFHAITFAYRLRNWPLAMRVYLRALTVWSEKMVAVSETLRRALISGGLPASKVATVPNPIPIERPGDPKPSSLPVGLQRSLESKVPILVSAGRICPMKGQDQLVEALPAIRKAYPKMMCLFVGRIGSSNGVEDTIGFFKVLRQRIRQLDLEENLIFLGEIDYLPTLLRCADLYVQTSWTESFGRVVAEALACNTPVVAFDVGAVREVAGPGSLLVKPGDTQGLAEAVVELTAYPDRRTQLARAGRERIERLYDARKVASRFCEVLASVVKQGIRDRQATSEQ